MPVDISIELFKAFPEEFHIHSKTHVTLIVCGIGHADVKTVKIGFSVRLTLSVGYQYQDGMLSHCV